MGTIRVEVVLALPEGHDAVEVEIAAGSRLRDAIAASGIATRHGSIDLSRCAAGRFGTVERPETVLADGDRVEIYRALPADPKEARRRRVKSRRRRPPG